MELTARRVSISEEHGVIALGLTGDEQARSQYMLLQRTLGPSKQDQELGHDRVHLQLSESTAGYCDFKKAILYQDRLALLLTRETAMQLAVDEAIDIWLPSEPKERSDLEAACQKLFGADCFQLCREST